MTLDLKYLIMGGSTGKSVDKEGFKYGMYAGLFGVGIASAGSLLQSGCSYVAGASCKLI